ncbi:GMC oxidoreductase [Roseovarius pacificus]|uniref:GMC oxidoreductase n=1 Tax=Roseovarius pacificus TaxID=337701 RepID=UPI004039FD1C
MTDLVIGSGPSGVSVATALLARGRQVLMLDGGHMPEAEALIRRDHLAAMEPRNWPAGTPAKWQAPQLETPPGQVRRFGSDFAMEPADETFTSAHGFGLRASRAEGGLSNLWGSAVLPNQSEDISDWPVTIDDLAPHYRAVAAFMPISGRSDDLETLLPAFSMQGRSALSPSPQAARLLDRLARQKSRLAEMGVHAGAARLAVDPACKYCGQCLHGCPWGYIWSARQTLDDLRRQLKFDHRSGIVRRFEESGGDVTVTLDNGETLRAERVFLAAGVLETARILLASQPASDARLQMKDSQHFFLPSLHRWRAPGRPDQMPYHTLPQAFMEIANPDVSPHLVHAQIYTWNEFYAHDLISNYGRKVPGSTPLWYGLARRLIVAQTFLHSDHSARIELALARDGRLVPSIASNPETGRVMAAAKTHLARALRKAGLLPLSFASRSGDPGSGFHAGGTVPMAAEPGPRDADIQGRPKGLVRVHVADASVLPSIPATTITFSVMANAHRIGMLAG